ncbi:Carbohydrate binding module (family 6) [Chitinophaga jiangningensis]|uniref:Carbohydrate binding module (Family 6) n=1 Tax=Chitinophaga jiangningensis TaxID=1419482 RepID=A0A1M7LTY0_9BACT|nr:cellulase family glycosylhydrolase [Chitinophaga jiangningensis]SHM81680.1 Carbohydrate binding module (family 6) [Chitinophaga jiangningensis]
MRFHGYDASFAKRVMVLSTLFLLFGLLANGQGYLKAKGHIIVNEKNEKVILRGMGLGGWMLQEGYMFRLGNVGQQYKIKAKIQELVGPEKTTEIYNSWLTSHTTKADIDSLAAWGFNSVRLPMHYELYTPAVEDEPVAGQQTWKEAGFALTDSLLSWCKANHLYLILDLHAAPGGQGNDLPISDRHPERPSLWESEANQVKTVALWKKLAARYANEPWIGGYDIINEPNWGFEDPADKSGGKEKTNAPLKKLMQEITAAIREVDKKHIIIIEGNAFGNNYNGILPTWDENMVLSFHKYGNFPDEASIARFKALREQYNVPLWLGESGENSNNWYQHVISLVERNDIGWAWWQQKKIGFNQPMEIRINPGFQAILDSWNGKGEQPAADAAYMALKEFVSNTKAENTIVHRDVVDAMFRQVRSTEAIPFREHVIGNAAVVKAVDYDLGGNGYAYSDRDTASYHYTPGVNTRGNRGMAYRNDGVDIKADKGAYYIFNTEDTEWLQYTVKVPKAGSYTINLTVAKDSADAVLAVQVNGKDVATGLAVPAAAGWQQVAVPAVKLDKGENRIRVVFAKGGCLFSQLEFKRK